MGRVEKCGVLQGSAVSAGYVFRATSNEVEKSFLKGGRLPGNLCSNYSFSTELR